MTSTQVATVSNDRYDAVGIVDNNITQFVTVIVDGQLFGLPVLVVHDILGPQKITRVPLSSSEVAGSLNLRGKIVTAIDVRQCIGLESRSHNTCMHVVVERNDVQYSLLVDQVGEVLNLSKKEYESNPPTLDARWKDVSMGIYRLPQQLMIVIDVEKLIRESSEKTGNGG